MKSSKNPSLLPPCNIWWTAWGTSGRVHRQIGEEGEGRVHRQPRRGEEGGVGEEGEGRVHREAERGEEGGVLHPVEGDGQLVEGEESHRIHQHVHD